MSDRGFRALLVAAAALWAVMAAASPLSCGGVWWPCSFDARFLPYAPAQARAYLGTLGEAALWRYLWLVQPLDLAFPALLCLWLREAFARWAPERPARWLGRVAVAYAGIDYLENAVVRMMLERPGGDFPDLVARAASGLTLAKWLVVAGLVAVLAGFRPARKGRG